MSADRDGLLDELMLRRASIADARAEHAAGELTDEQLATLVQREQGSLLLCEKKLEDLDRHRDAQSSPARTRTRSLRLHRQRYLLVALGSFAVAVVLFLLVVLSPRQPGGSDTGGISATKAHEIVTLLRQGELDQLSQNSAAALQAFNAVLILDAHNVEALTQSGWLTFSAGSASHDVIIVRLGEERIALAVALAPGDPDPRLYFAITAYSTPGNRALAIGQFKIFLQQHPRPALLIIAHPYLVRLGLTHT